MARNDIGKLLKDLDRIAATTLYNGPKAVAEKAVRELQDIGPQWTGRFSNSWEIKTPDKTTRGTGGEGAPRRIYTPSVSGRQVTRSFLTKNKLLFTVSNFSPYADQATDLAPFNPTKLKDQTPLKTPEYGKRPPGGLRGDLRGSGGNRRTADLDWFTNYLRAGKFDKTLQITMDAEIRKSGGFK